MCVCVFFQIYMKYRSHIPKCYYYLFFFPLLASPATWALLQSFGWSCLPNKSDHPSDCGDHTQENAGGSCGGGDGEVKATLAGEFDAED